MDKSNVARFLAHSVSLITTSVSAKWHQNLSNSLSNVREYEKRQTARPPYGEMCRYRWNQETIPLNNTKSCRRLTLT